MFRYKHYVYEVYKERSFSRAAANLYISQPSLSARIIKIEEEIGMPIFDRSTSPIKLTEFGTHYISAIEEIMRIESGVENRVNDINTLHSGELSLGASNVFAAYVLPPIIAEFRRIFPDVKVKLVEGNTQTLEQMMAINDLDIVIDNNRYDEDLYDCENYAEEQILLAAPRCLSECKAARKYELSDSCIRRGEYPESECMPLPLSLFGTAPFIMLTQGNDTRIRGEKMCREAGFRPRIAIEVNQQATSYMIATSGMGCTFVSDTVVMRLPMQDSMAYYKLASPSARRSVCFYSKKHKRKTRAMLEFIKLISKSN